MWYLPIIIFWTFSVEKTYSFIHLMRDTSIWQVGGGANWAVFPFSSAWLWKKIEKKHIMLTILSKIGRQRQNEATETKRIAYEWMIQSSTTANKCLICGHWYATGICQSMFMPTMILDERMIGYRVPRTCTTFCQLQLQCMAMENFRLLFTWFNISKWQALLTSNLPYTCNAMLIKSDSMEAWIWNFAAFMKNRSCDIIYQVSLQFVLNAHGMSHGCAHLIR